jgi:hypothetical protein
MTLPARLMQTLLNPPQLRLRMSVLNHAQGRNGGDRMMGYLCGAADVVKLCV